MDTLFLGPDYIEPLSEDLPQVPNEPDDDE